MGRTCRSASTPSPRVTSPKKLGERLADGRPGWTVLLAPTLHLGSFTFDAVQTVRVRRHVVRDALVDHGLAARAGFRYILVANGHGRPRHLTALEEAAAIVSRRRDGDGVVLGHLAWQFLRGRYLSKIETALGRPLSDDERRAFADDAHGGWWETSLMLLLRPDLVDASYRTLPPARYSLAERVDRQTSRCDTAARDTWAIRLAAAFARAAVEVLMAETMTLVDGSSTAPSGPRRPLALLRAAVLRTEFWPVTLAATVGVAIGSPYLTLGARARGRRSPRERWRQRRSSSLSERRRRLAAAQPPGRPSTRSTAR